MIVVVCGPPAAGKTTLVSRVRDRLATEDTPVSTLHSDDFSRDTYDRLYDRVAADPGRNWVVDGTFYREAWQARFRELGARFVFVTAPLAVRLERNRRRDDPISETGVRVVSAEFRAPDADLTLDTGALGVDAAVDRLHDAVSEWLADERRAGSADRDDAVSGRVDGNEDGDGGGGGGADGGRRT